MKKVTAVVVGAGQRGRTYASYALDFPNRLTIKGVAEPREYHRRRLQTEHQIPDTHAFKSWEEVLELEKFADFAIISMLDQLHKAAAVAFASKGYHLLLEKPMAVTADDCEEIVATCKKHGVILAVCHVLRYTPQARKIRALIQSGVIGKVVNIQLLEPVGYYHFAHSFVRGNWRNEGTSTFCLLAKSCHDIDLIRYWTPEKKCVRVASFGSLIHFNKASKPNGASSRCLDCKVESSCAYSAKKIYLDLVQRGHTGWPVSVIVDQPDIESVTEALKSGPYGRCVYECDNDVVDNQVVNMQFSDGATATFTMVAFTEEVCTRKTTIFGTKGELKCDFGHLELEHYDFLTRKRVTYDLNKEASDSMTCSRLHGHGGADFFAIDAFVEALATNDPSKILTGADESLASHLLTFQAERARIEGRVINTADAESSINGMSTN